MKSHTWHFEAQGRPRAAAKLVGVPVGENPTRGTCPVAPVVISGGGARDQSAGSPEAKVLVGWVKTWSAPTGGQQSGRDRASASRCPDSHAYRTGRSASTLETEIAASLLLVGALLEAATASMLGDRYGRKKSLMFSAAMAEDRSTSEGIL
jgi:hypothetical protein